jgi:hypothetical protein
MRTGYKGKYTSKSRRNPHGNAVCDYSGLNVAHHKLVRQMEYSGSRLRFTGFWVNPRYADVPNPQNLIVLIRQDPVPLDHARPDPYVMNYANPTANIDVSGNSNITLTFAQFNNNILNFTGALTGNVVIYIPAVFNQFHANNLTTGDFTLSIQIVAQIRPPLLIRPVDPITNQGVFFGSDGQTLQILYGPK